MKLPSNRFFGVMALACLIIFAVTANIAHRGNITGWEASIFHTIYNFPLWLLWPMLVITQAGSSWMIISVSVFLIYLRKLKLFYGVVITSVVTALIVEALKRIVARPRPFVLLPGVFARERFVADMGFPSGHTAAATAVAMIVFWYLPKRWRPIVPVWIILVALSRIYLGVHAPLDIIGGWAIGSMMAAFFFVIRSRLHKRKRRMWR